MATDVLFPGLFRLGARDVAAAALDVAATAAAALDVANISAFVGGLDSFGGGRGLVFAASMGAGLPITAHDPGAMVAGDRWVSVTDANCDAE